MKKILVLMLALALCLPAPALAVEEVLPWEMEIERHFPVKAEYPGFIDVDSGDWYLEAAIACCETGLMRGTGQAFDPGGILTIGETAAIAARINEILTGDLIPDPIPNPGLPWYQHYMDYLEGLGIPLPAGDTQATRLDFLKLLAAVLPDELLPPRNDITRLPDTTDGDVLRFYNAGILIGLDGYGTFAGDRTLTRAECAAMVARIVRPGLRLGFVPNDCAPLLAAGLAAGDVLFTTESGAITAGAYLPAVVAVIDELEAVCAGEGVAFNWFHTYGEQTFLDYVKETSLSAFGVTQADGTDLYRNLDLQVFYSRLLDLRTAS